jgi:prepilin-type processing-associated H-X9-DG protein
MTESDDIAFDLNVRDNDPFSRLGNTDTRRQMPVTLSQPQRSGCMLFIIISSAVAFGIFIVIAAFVFLSAASAHHDSTAARITADRAKCASNEHQIGIGIILFQSDHNGKYPDDLGSLFKSEEVSAYTFVCPTGNTEEPVGFADMPRDAQAKWVNEHSDYVYVGKGLSGDNIPATRIVLYEKEGAHNGEGMNILFADGHAEWFNAEEAKLKIGQQQDNKK